MKKYVFAAIDLNLFAIALSDKFEHGVRILALIAGLIVSVYTIRKMRQDFENGKLHRDNMLIDKQIKEQALARELMRNKNSNPDTNETK